LRFAVILAPYAAVLAFYLGARIAVLHGFAHPASEVALRSSALAIPWVLQFYISQMLVPVGLGPFYDINRNTLDISGLVLPLLVLVFLVFCLWWWTRKSRNYLAVFLAIWFLLTLAPALGVFLMLPRNEGVHDRYLYLPSVAFAILIGFIWVRVSASAQGHTRSLYKAVAGLLLITLGVATWQQTRYWKDDLTLFSRARAVAPHNSLARLNLAAELIRRHRVTEAFAEAQAVIDQDPRSGLAFAMAAESAYFAGEYAKAETYYGRALKLGPVEPEHLFYLAMSQIQLGHYTKSLELIRRVLSVWPDLPRYHYAMGLAFVGLQDWLSAREQFSMELALHPESSMAAPALQDAERHLQSVKEPSPRKSK
jgi:Flp pilus assembly protein TadD